MGSFTFLGVWCSRPVWESVLDFLLVNVTAVVAFIAERIAPAIEQNEHAFATF